MKKIILTLIVISPVALINAQQYTASLIPDSLRRNSNVIKRYEEKIYEIKSPRKAVMKEKHVYTIFNENGASYGYYNSFYDKFTSINYINGTLYDSLGKELRHVKTKDMQDVFASDGISLANDDRVKKNEFYSRTFPYTVAYEEEDDIDGLLYFSDWNPLSSPDLSVEYSRYVIIAPEHYVVRYKLFNNAPQPTITQKGDKKIYTWEIRNLKAKGYEPLAPFWKELVPYVMMAPSEFEVNSYKGNFSSWLNVGKFIWNLKSGRDILPDDIKIKVHELTDKLKSPYDKITALYEFLQKNSRYVSIQLGLGGWQPFDAQYVASNRYGDCKALSNYMVALLKEAGVKANYVVVNSGKNAAPMEEDFSSLNQFNHIIACVPLARDTVWLECTSQTESAGYMGSFTGDRKVLLIDEDGGHVVRTPVYDVNDNQTSRNIFAKIDIDGTLEADMYTSYKGVSQEFYHSLKHYYTKDEREKTLNRIFKIPTYQIEQYDYEEIKGFLPEIREHLKIVCKNLVATTGKRMFIEPNLVNKEDRRYIVAEERKYDVVIKDAFRSLDTVQIKIPDGYVLEALPKKFFSENKYGKFSIHYAVDSDTIKVIRYYEQWRGRYSKSEFDAFAKHYNDIYKADRARIVFVKKEG